MVDLITAVIAAVVTCHGVRLSSSGTGAETRVPLMGFCRTLWVVVDLRVMGDRFVQAVVAGRRGGCWASRVMPYLSPGCETGEDNPA
ncbi:hypothetical protein Lesp02_04200 [Lentzea sp. NBRC 105346]|nr:hypothetical protein Lesp02_04200 [Lentzea sp. NBRC 105346]